MVAHTAVRALPVEDREDGNPFASELQERQRAARLEGRKVRYTQQHASSSGHFAQETLYKVELFRRFLERRGTDGKGLVQFYGIKATRRRYLFNPDGTISHEPFTEWNVQGPRLHTVAVGDIQSIR